MSATFRLVLKPFGIMRGRKKEREKKKSQTLMSWLLDWNLLHMFKKYKWHLLPCIAGSSNRNLTCQIEYMPLNLSSLRSGTQGVTKTWGGKKKEGTLNICEMLWKKSVNSVFQPPASQFFLSDVNSFQQKDLGVQICMKCWQFKKKKCWEKWHSLFPSKFLKFLFFYEVSGEVS